MVSKAEILNPHCPLESLTPGSPANLTTPDSPGMEHEHWYFLAFKVITVQPGLRMTAGLGKDHWWGLCSASYREKATGPNIKRILGPRQDLKPETHIRTLHNPKTVSTQTPVLLLLTTVLPSTV